MAHNPSVNRVFRYICRYLLRNGGGKMPDFNNFKFKPHIKLPKVQFGRGGKRGRGGDGGQIFIFADKIVEKGKILADGGEGIIGGKGGNVHIVTKESKFAGIISSKGGKSAA